MIRKLIVAATALLALGAAAAAAPDQERPKLKPEATVTGNIVRIGDLVEHAGIVAMVPIFRAPDLGSTGTVSAEAVIEAVRNHALIGLDTGDLSEVVVTRASRVIPAKDIEERVAQALSAQYALGPRQDIVVNFDRELRTIQVESTTKGEPRVAYLNYDSRSGRFDVTLDMPTGATTRGTLQLSGRAAGQLQRAAGGGAGRHIERDVEAAAAAVVIEVGDARLALGGRFHLDGAQLAVEIHHDVLARAERVLRRQRLRDALLNVLGRDHAAGPRHHHFAELAGVEPDQRMVAHRLDHGLGRYRSGGAE